MLLQVKTSTNTVECVRAACTCFKGSASKPSRVLTLSRETAQQHSPSHAQHAAHLEHTTTPAHNHAVVHIHTQHTTKPRNLKGEKRTTRPKHMQQKGPMAMCGAFRLRFSTGTSVGSVLRDMRTLFNQRAIQDFSENRGISQILK